MIDDPYALLEVTADAGPDQIRRAYRRLARDLHPDLNPGKPDVAERFRLVTAAYQTLCNPRTRVEFDRTHPTPPASDGPANPFQEAGRRWAAHGQDVLAVVDLDLAGAALGGTFPVKVNGPVQCEVCHGDGYDPHGATVTCWTCDGSGRAVYRNRFGDTTATCLTCGGEGRQSTEKCAGCEGAGTVVTERIVEVVIPPGTDDGDTITVTGEGGPGGRGGDDGDLLVVTRVAPHPVFRRKGLDLEMAIPLSLAEAVLGTSVELPTLVDPITVRVPAGAQGGSVLRVKGAGIATPAATGDLRVTLNIVVPTDVTPSVRHALELLGQPTAAALRARLFHRV